MGPVAEDLFGVDGKLLRTGKVLAWPPGGLTLEWSRGRRVHSLSPIGLYLAAAVLFFLVWLTTGFASGLEEFIRGFVDARGGPTGSSAQLGAEIITESLPGLLIIFFVPFFAAVLQVLNRGAGAFVSHLVMALHVHTMFFAGIVAAAPFGLILGERWERVGEPVLFLFLFAYLCASIARVYDIAAWRAVGRSLVLVSIYSVVAVMAVAGTLLVVL